MNEMTKTANKKMVVDDRFAHVDEEQRQLIAALAATLLEYRGQAAASGVASNKIGAGRNWRTLARMEQIRGSL